MNNQYIFIIWNKALWCKDRILNDLKESFSVIKTLYIKWDKEYYIDNLNSLYGRKIGSAKEKIAYCGNKEFFLVIVRDDSPKYEPRQMYDGIEQVNSNIYDKKMLYRKWTAGGHRIHCSDTIEETKHDLAVLFGSNYEEILNNTKDNTTLHLNTKSIIGFNDINEIIDNLQLFGNNKCFIINNDLYIFTKYHIDMEYYLKLNKINNNKYLYKDNNIYIFGEADGELPINSYSKINQEIANSIANNYDEYINYINNKESNIFKELFIKNSIELVLIKEIDNHNKRDGIFKRIYNKLKLVNLRLFSNNKCK